VPDPAESDPLAPDEIQVRSGRAQLLSDADRPGGILLLVDRVRQSYVDLDDPTYLDFEYVRSLADIIDALPEGRLAVTHVGGGGCTLPRYVAATRPGSSQVVLEPDDQLIELVRSRLPLPARSGIRIRPVDGVAGIAALPDAGADVVVIDAFLGGRVPAELTAPPLLADARRVLRPTGVLMFNLADGPPLTYLRRVLATLGNDFAHVLAVSDASVLRGRRFGNVVLAAANVELPHFEIARAAASATFPRRVRAGRELTRLIGGLRPFTAQDMARSPAPPEHTWRVQF
jgi:SAM-dependent methyltransferase